MLAATNNGPERLAAALVSPDGEVIQVIAIATATDLEVKAAQRHAQQHGFTLVVRDEAPFCVDEDGLHQLILRESIR
jgi:nicotinamidase-related amidase